MHGQTTFHSTMAAARESASSSHNQALETCPLRAQVTLRGTFATLALRVAGPVLRHPSWGSRPAHVTRNRAWGRYIRRLKILALRDSAMMMKRVNFNGGCEAAVAFWGQ